MPFIPLHYPSLYPKMNLCYTNENLMHGEGYPLCLRPHKANSRTTKLIMESSILPSLEFTIIYRYS